MMGHVENTGTDETLPPTRMLRFDTPGELFEKIPELAEFVQNAPEPHEDMGHYINRLRHSPTPEDAVTVIPFAMEPHIAVDWGVEAVQANLPEMSPDDMQLMNWVGEWLDMPNSQNRWGTLQRALFATRRSAAVYLALGVGWSGGPLAPNDPVEMPLWRAPRAISSAVLRALGQVALDHKDVAPR